MRFTNYISDTVLCRFWYNCVVAGRSGERPCVLLKRGNSLRPGLLFMRQAVSPERMSPTSGSRAGTFAHFGFSFHSKASLSPSVICAGVIFAATRSRLSRASVSPGSDREAARFSHM